MFIHLVYNEDKIISLLYISILIYMCIVYKKVISTNNLSK